MKREKPISLRSAGAVGFLTLLSRLAGLLRVNTVAKFLGTGAEADAFRVALLVPNLFRRFVGEGAIAAAFVPVLAAYHRDEDRDKLRRISERLFTFWSLLLLVVTGAGILVSGWLLFLYAGWAGLGAEGGAWNQETVALTAQLMQWLFVYLFLIGLAALGQAILNAVGIFALPALTPLIFNLVFVAAAYALSGVFPDEKAPWAFVVGVLVGGICQFGTLVPALWKLGIRWRPRWPGSDPDVQRVVKLLIPATFGAGIYQINVLVATLIAMSIDRTGAVASLDFSSRLMEFALGVFVFGLSTVGLTALSRQVEAGDGAAVRSTATQLARLAFFMTLPSAVGLLVLGEPIVDLLLRGGKFDADSTELTLIAFRYHVPGLVFVGTSRVLVSVFYAHKDVRLPVLAGGVSFVVNTALCLWLSTTELQHGGIALAATLSALVHMLFLGYCLQIRRRALDVQALTSSIFRAIVATTAMGAACLGLLRIYPSGGGRAGLALEVALVITAGVVVYFAISKWLGATEVSELLGRFSRRRDRESD